MKKVISLVLSLVMLLSVTAGLNFSAQASTVINKIEINDVPEPKVGATIESLMTFTVPLGQNDYSGVSQDDITKNIYWLDLDSKNPTVALPQDTVCIKGHRYKVCVRVMAKGDAYFANLPTATINGKAATTSAYGGYLTTKRLQLEYTYPAVDYKYISNVQLNADVFERGSVTSTDFFYSPTDGVDMVITAFSRDGAAIPAGTEVTPGNYGVTVGLTPLDGYRFADNVKVKNGYNEFNVSHIGTAIFAKSADDYYKITCSHEYGDEYQYDATNHWKVCSECGEKNNVEAHDYNKVAVDGGTKYTCKVCGYEKTANHVLNDFLYADVDNKGNIEIVSYKGSNNVISVPSKLGGKTVVAIGDYAFANAKNKTTITSITLPSTVNTISEGAFNGCSSLVNVNIPRGVKRIEFDTFSGCSSLKSITIPYGVEYIGTNAFMSTGLINVIIPCSVKTISTDAFSNSALVSVVIPDSVTSMGKSFNSCTSLKEVVIGNGITSIAYLAFASCPIETLTLPAGLASISGYNFSDSNLKTINFRGTQSQYEAISKGNNKSKMDAAAKVYNYSEKIDVGQHKYNKLDAVAPTCIDEGYTLNVCEGCGDSFKTNVTAKTGVHNYNSGAVIIEATCKDEGTKVYTCKVCASEKNEAIAKTTNHTWGKGVLAKQATLTQAGNIKQTCTVCQTAVKNTPIAKINSVALSKSIFTYNKKVQRPAVVVKDSAGKVIAANNYDVAYSNVNSKKYGAYKVTVKFKGNYAGATALTYYISPKGTTLSKATSPKSKQIKATWKKQTKDTNGYEVQVATNAAFTQNVKTVNVKKNKTTSATISKLKSKKTYYVRVRTYKTVGKTKCYSAWSAAKKVKKVK